jgi:methyl-accepting chemotaxis protein
MSNKISSWLVSIGLLVFLILFVWSNNFELLSVFLTLVIGIVTITLAVQGAKRNRELIQYINENAKFINQRIENVEKEYINYKKNLESNNNSIKPTLNDSGNKVINNLESKFQKHTKDKEKINTIAVIERIWNTSQENYQKKGSFSNHIRLESWDECKRSYQILPNSLLAIGLAGTFLGITLQLLQLWNQNVGTESIKSVAASMSIAFISSLVSLVASFILNKYFPPHRIDIQEERLMTSFEYYIDNVYLPYCLLGEKDLNDRFDDLIITIGNYSDELNNFVNKFPKLIQVFEEAANNASDTLTSSANNFQSVATSSSNAMQTGANALTGTTDKLSGVMNTLLDSTVNLNSAIQSLNTTTERLDSYTQTMVQIESALSENSVSLDDTAESLNSTTEQFQTCIEKMADVSISLGLNSSNLDGMVNYLNSTTGRLESYTQTMAQIEPALSKNSVSLNNMAKSLNSTTEKISAHTLRMENVDDIFRENLVSLNKTRESFDQTTGQLQVYIQQFPIFSNSLESNSSLLHTMTSALQDKTGQFTSVIKVINGIAINLVDVKKSTSTISDLHQILQRIDGRMASQKID